MYRELGGGKKRPFWWMASAVLLASLVILTLGVVMRSGALAADERPFDFGDAPDSTDNHYASPNIAYSGPITGRFPTVWDGVPASAPSGPVHFDLTKVWLGEAVTPEAFADQGIDADGINNILLDAAGTVDPNLADQDGADDGWLNPRVPIVHCRQTFLRVQVSRAAGTETGRMYLNVWFDGNRDGEWNGVAPCQDARQRAHEWIVKNYVIDTSLIQGSQDLWIPTGLVLNEEPDQVAWMRFTLSESPAVHPATGALADGRGPAYPAGFKLGETEDYLYQPSDEGEPGTLVITKTVSLAQAVIGDVLEYRVALEHKGGTAPVYSILSDILPAEVKLVDPPKVMEVNPTVVPLLAHFNPGVGPSGAVRWMGYLSPGAKLLLTFPVKVVGCPSLVEPRERPIVNVAQALYPDGTQVQDEAKTLVDCDPPSRPELELTKRVIIDEPTKADSALLPGYHASFELTLKNLGVMTRTVRISDDLPSGLVAVSAHATQGVVHIIAGGHTVIWKGQIAPQQEVRIRIRVRSDDAFQCDRVLINQAHWYSDGYTGTSNAVRVFVRCHDLGDAPDSTNHFAPITMTAYGGTPPVLATYPTVYSDTITPVRGPMHVYPRPFHLGRRVSFEVEADVGPDMDPVNNIIPLKDIANRDRWDDGLDPSKVAFKHCEVTRFPVVVSIAPQALPLLRPSNGLGYLNVWLDGNRNGDWDDVHDCPGYNGAVPEHIVIDWPVNANALGPGLHVIYVSTVEPVYWPSARPAWLRATLSERPSNKPFSGGAYGDGRGYVKPFKLGETEDYVWRQPEEEPVDLVVEKDGRLRLTYDREMQQLGWVAQWKVAYKNQGGSTAPATKLIDAYSPNQTLVGVHSHPPLPATGGNPMTFGIGTLAPGAGGWVMLRTHLPITTPPGTIITNTAVITDGPDANPADNRAVVTLTVPLRRPIIVTPRPGTTCTGTVTVRGRAQVGVKVELYVNGSLTATVPVDAGGRWTHTLMLPDGTYDLHAIARIDGLTSPPSPVVQIIVDRSLSWDPLSLRFIDENGHVILPKDASGRMDPTGWRVFLRRDTVFTATVRVCCTDPNAQVKLEVPYVGDVSLVDPDGDRIFEGSFTTPNAGPIAGPLRLCTICNLVQVCSDGSVLIDPEGTVFDVTQTQALDGANVACTTLQDDEQGESLGYVMWDADAYGQENPQTTMADGYFSFFTPAGTYRLEVDRAGYQPFRSWDLIVVDEPVHYDVPLTPALSETPDYTVTIGMEGFDPAYLVVEPGSVVAWLNADLDWHTTTSLTPTVTYGGMGLTALGSEQGWDSGLLDPGEVYHRQLSSVGTYTYYDHENGVSIGTIEVAHRIYLPLVMRQ
jgi:uncharacterized repeat protein (TIGR01451 family)